MFGKGEETPPTFYNLLQEKGKKMESEREDIQNLVKDEIENQFKIFFSFKKLMIGLIAGLAGLIGSTFSVYSAIQTDLDKKYASKTETTSSLAVQDEVNKNMEKTLIEIKGGIVETKTDIKTVLKELGNLNGKLENLPSRLHRK